MTSPVCRSAIASLFVMLLAACGAEDDEGGMTDEAPVTTATCITLVGQTCGCPDGRTYGKFACDGSCTQCVAPVAGSGVAGAGTAGTAATSVPGPGRGAAGSGIPSGAAGRGMAGAPSMPAPAGMAGLAGAPGGAAGAPMAGVGGAAGGGGGVAPVAGAPAPGGTTSGAVPDGPVCAPVATWSAEWAGFEDEVLRLVNENRAKGWNCDAEGMFPPAGPLTMIPTLRCSARLHSKDMADRMFFDHANPDMENPGTRMKEAGYVGAGWGENIARGQRTPAEVVTNWMDSDGHCSNIMNASFNQIGVGYFAGMSTNPRYNSELYWTQNFGAAAAARP